MTLLLNPLCQVVNLCYEVFLYLKLEKVVSSSKEDSNSLVVVEKDFILQTLVKMCRIYTVYHLTKQNSDSDTPPDYAFYVCTVVSDYIVYIIITYDTVVRIRIDCIIWMYSSMR